MFFEVVFDHKNSQYKSYNENACYFSNHEFQMYQCMIQTFIQMHSNEVQNFYEC